ncbi:hypothetical protein PQC07_gp248 [Aeromonas phage D3]|uniref:Uncharacterized protein n=1 Tax=Aeromonas phage D3 TaxID=2593327 RepID=A0A7D6F700_9CAUD|nr:hypothetical protein PQC07_gp248 [Aeromonas phage D3]QLM02893.1 hypothetical protein D3_0027 [Aeromonas phage D3]
MYEVYMSDIRWYQENDRMVIVDNETQGTLHIRFNPMNRKTGSDLMWGHVNDISASIENGDLQLSLKGHSMIDVRSDIELRGSVTLKTAFLHDPVIENSHIDFVSITAKTVFKDAHVHAVGIQRFGLVKFINSKYDGFMNGALPKARELQIVDNQVKVIVQ